MSAERPRRYDPTETPRSRSAAERRQSGGRGPARSQSRAARPTPAAASADTRRWGGFRWAPLEAVAIVSVTFSAFGVKEVLSASEAVQGLHPDLVVPARVLLLAAYYAIQAAVLVWLVRRRGGEPLRALGLRAGRPTVMRALTSAGLVVAGLIGTRLVASLYAFVTRELGLMPEVSMDLPTVFGSSAVGFVVAVLMVVIIGPLMEEAVFRAALLEGLAARFGAMPAILIQAALFAALHRSWWLLFPTFVLGVVLGWLAHERGSLWPPLVLHALYNAITVTAAFMVA